MHRMQCGIYKYPWRLCLRSFRERNQRTDGRTNERAAAERHYETHTGEVNAFRLRGKCNRSQRLRMSYFYELREREKKETAVGEKFLRSPYASWLKATSQRVTGPPVPPRKFTERRKGVALKKRAFAIFGFKLNPCRFASGVVYSLSLSLFRTLKFSIVHRARHFRSFLRIAVPLTDYEVDICG